MVGRCRFARHLERARGSATHWITLFAAMAMALAAAAGCSPQTASADRWHARDDRPYPIVCTTGMVADLVSHVGGEHVEVEALMGEGVDPHLYKAGTRDVAKLFRARVVFYSGLHLEGKLADVFERLAEKKPVHAVAASIPAERLLELEEGQYDPHVWFDVSLWSSTLPAIAEALCEYDPAHAGDYRQNAAEYRAALLELHAECQRRLAEIPEQRRVLVTPHDAFRYFHRAYRIEVRAIQGVSTESEAGVSEINDLVSFLSNRGIKAVFVETSVSDRNIQALVEGCRARGHDVNIGGELYSDAMGAANTEAGSYAGMVRHNVDALVRALQ